MKHNFRHIKIHGLTLFLLLFFSLSLFSVEIRIDDAHKNYKIIKKDIYVDDTKDITIDDILSSPGKYPFNESDKINFGFTDSAYWVKFKIDNVSQDSKFQILFDSHLFKKLSLFLVDSQGAVSQRIYHDISDRSKLNQRDRTPHFLLNIDKNKEYTLFIRFENDYANMILSIEIHTLSSFAEWFATESYIFGFLFGFIIVILLYNACLLFSLRDKSYFYYVIFLFFNLLFQMLYTGAGYQFLFYPVAFEYFKYFELVFVIVYILFSCSIILFTKEFLNIKRKWIQIIFISYISTFTLFSILMLVGVLPESIVNVVVNVESAFFGIFLIVMSFLLYVKGNKSAIF
ncbi:MAG: hypothetical protein JW969_15950, partial [Spirochaetales bacterium]|nr:hypothetical protein [Spirochaetales bacterium]